MGGSHGHSLDTENIVAAFQTSLFIQLSVMLAAAVLVPSPSASPDCCPAAWPTPPSSSPG
ncbi:hypothetical protein FHS40_008789 [Streptomyces spectabilis]|uniref:Uncharacterized protein n=1 Tax=Streptomyces spectabilis TaxID=68270 RepID=A0A7W8B3G4_STRST|nr:hypothetical protein [Streptomyces spectabilis]